MRTPESLETLVDYGIIDEVVRPLMSGKEAQVYVVVAGGEQYVAKVYKEASQRTFKHRVEYTEGRRTRNSRDARAVSKRTRHGRKQDEAAWRTAEVDMIYRLRDAGVRVPEPINFVDGVLVMELVKDAQGNPAPRLGDLSFGAEQAHEIYQTLIREVVRMLCAGVIHGDLSDFNVLMAADGPVLIDFPQSVDPAHNQSARKLLLRDVDNLHHFLERFAPGRPTYSYAQEMWALYQANRLESDTELRGDYRAPQGKARTDEVLALIDDADLEEKARRRARGSEPEADFHTDFDAIETTETAGSVERGQIAKAPKPLRAVVDFTKEARPRSGTRKRSSVGSEGRSKRSRKRSARKPARAQTAPPDGDAAPKTRRRRSRRKATSEPAGEAAARSSLRDTAPPEKKTAASDEAKGPTRRRRGRRSGNRSKSRETKVEAEGDKAERALKPAAGGRAGTARSNPSGGTDRPSSRRRRRSRAAASRKTT